VRRRRLHPDLLEPAGAHDLSQATGIVAIGFACLQRESGLGMPGIDHVHRQTALLESVPQPYCERPRLHADATRRRSVLAQPTTKRLRFARHLALSDHAAGLVDHTQRCHPERYVQTHKLRHRGSPQLTVRFCTPNPARPGQSGNPPRDDAMLFIRAGVWQVVGASHRQLPRAA
jgi:hypothetical protein